jgi:hypothetical protein
MTLRHTVVFRLPYEMGSGEERAFLEAARAALTSIPGVHEFLIERQVSPKSDLTLAFSMRFDDEAAYASYNAHPAHVAFVQQRWETEVEAFQEYDYTVL